MLSSMADNLFDAALGTENGTGYRMSHAIAKAFADRAVVEIGNVFDIEDYIRGGHCEAQLRQEPYSQVQTHWRRTHGLSHALALGIYDVKWQGKELVVARAEWPEGFRGTVCKHYVIADDRALAESFTDAVCEYCNSPGNAVLTFRGGCWQRDYAMFATIQQASFDDLVLVGDLVSISREASQPPRHTRS